MKRNKISTMLYFKFSIIIALINCQNFYGQPQISFQSPVAASLGKYVEMPVSNFTGIPNTSIQLYEIKEGDFSMPISLNYHATAFNPNEQPGWVGMGWSLNAGGVITRKVNAWPDDCFYYSSVYDAAFTGNYYNTDVHTQLKQYIGKTYVGETITGRYPFADPTYATEIIDGQPDEFSFNFNGYSGKFYFKYSVPVIVGNSGLKIEVDSILYTENFYRYLDNQASVSYISYSIKGFRITTPDGYKYEFGHKWETHNQYDNVMEAVDRSKDLTDVRSNFYTTNAWYLVRVVSPNNKEVMTLTYNHYDWNGPQNQSIKRNLTLWRGVNYTDISGTRSMNVSLSGKIIYPCYLSKISTQNQVIDFTTEESNQLMPNYFDIKSNLIDRYPNINISNLLDCQNQIYSNFGNQQLTNIAVSDKNSNKIKSFDFNYTNNNKERLRLLRLQEEGTNPYLFDYDNLANRYILKESNDRLIGAIEYANLSVDEWGNYVSGYMPSFLVNKYTNGSYLTYENDGDRSHYVFSDKLRDPSEIVAIENDMRNEQPAIRGTYDFSLNKIIYPTGGYTSLEYEPHTYTNYVDRDSNGNPTLKNAIVEDNEGELSISGIRVKRIKFYDGINANSRTTKTYYYEKGILTGIPKYFYESNCGFTTKRVVALDYSSLGSDLSSVLNFFLPPTYAGGTYSMTNIYYYNSSLIPMSSNGSGSYIGYSKVSEVLGIDTTFYDWQEDDTRITQTQGEYGKKEFYYRNFQDHPSLYTQEQLNSKEDIHLDIYKLYGSGNCLPSNAIFPLTNFDMERGMLIGTNTFDKSNNLLNNERDYYSKPDNASDYAISSRCQKSWTFSVPTDPYNSTSNVWVPDMMDYSIYFNFDYDVYYYPFNLTKKTTTDYLSNGTVSTETNYVFENDKDKNYNYLVSENTIINNGKKIEKQYRNINNILLNNQSTPSNTSDYSILKSMSDIGLGLNMVEEQTLEVLPDNTKLLIGGGLTKYKNFGDIVNQLYKPSEIYKLNISQPTSDLTYVNLASNGDLSYHSKYKKEYQMLNYDANANINYVTKDDEIKTVYLWGYNFLYPIAEIMNATYDQVVANLGIDPAALAASIVPNMTNVDALRAKLPNALVTTYTYKPLVGMLTATAPNGIVTTYVYDTFNRLKYTIDTNGKIVKGNQYHYSNQ